MSNVIRSLIVKVGADLTDMQKGLKQASKDFKKVGKDLTNIGNSLTKTLTLPILGIGAASIKLASDVQESINKVDVAFGSNANEVKSWSKTTLESFGIAKGTALDMAALFGDMATSMGFSTGNAAKMSTSLVGLAGDLASFKNISIDVASTALKSIFTGETESLKNLGIVMTQTNLNAFALANGIKKTVQEMTQAEQVQLRYNYVMSMTKNAQGDFARTSEGTANQIRILQEGIKEAAASIGENLLPAVSNALQKINNLTKSFASLNPETQKNIILFGGLALAAGPVISSVGKLFSGIGSLTLSFSKLISGGGALSNIISKLGGGFGLISAAITIFISLIGMNIAEWNKYQFAGKKINDTINQQTKAYKDNIQAIEKSQDEDIAKAELARDLTNDLYNLNEQVKSGTLSETEAVVTKRQMHSIADQLKQIIPECEIAFNNETGAIITQRDEIDNLINSYINLAKAKAYQSKLEETYKAIVDAEINKRQTESKLYGANYNVDFYDERRKEYQKNQVRPPVDLDRDWAYAKRDAKEYKETIDGLDNSLIEYYDTVEFIKQAMKESNITIVDTTKSTTGLNNTIADTGSKTKDSTKTIKNSIDTVKEAYKKLYNEQKNNLEMGIISEEEYYAQLAALGTEYFTYNGNVIEKYKDDYQAVIDEIVNYQVKKFNELRQKVTNTYAIITENSVNELQKIYDAQNTLENKLKGYAKLFETYTITVENAGRGLYWDAQTQSWINEKDIVTTKTVLGNLTKANTELEQYNYLLETLQEKGLDEGIFNQLLEMDIPEAIKNAQTLLDATSEEFEAYNKEFQKNQELSNKYASNVYAKKVKKTIDEFKTAIETSFSTLPKELEEGQLKAIGESVIDGLNQGMENKSDEVKNTLSDIITNAISSVKAQLGIASPSKFFRDKIGLMIGTGLAEGIRNSKKLVSNALLNLNSDALAKNGYSFDVSANNDSLALPNNNNKTINQNNTIIANQPMSPAEIAAANKRLLQQAAFMLT